LYPIRFTAEKETIGANNYKRDFSSGIDQMIDELADSSPMWLRLKYLSKIRHDKLLLHSGSAPTD
jgi:hypothetical protein